MRAHTRRLIAWAALAGPLHACTTWQTRAAPAPASLGGTRVSERNPVRITTRDGRVLTLTALVISGDSLVGVQGDTRRNDARVAVALADVQSVADRQVDPARTRGLIAGVAGVAAALALAFLYLLASDPS